MSVRLEGHEQVEQHLRDFVASSRVYANKLRRQARDASVSPESLLDTCQRAVVNELQADAVGDHLVVLKSEAEAVFRDVLCGDDWITTEDQLAQRIVDFVRRARYYVSQRRPEGDADEIISDVQRTVGRGLHDQLPVRQGRVKGYFWATIRLRVGNDSAIGGWTGAVRTDPCPLCSPGGQLGCTSCGGKGVLRERILPDSEKPETTLKPAINDDDSGGSTGDRWIENASSDAAARTGEAQPAYRSDLAALTRWALSKVTRRDQLPALAIALEAIRQISFRALTVRPTHDGFLDDEPRHTFGGHGPRPTTNRDTQMSDVIDQVLQVYDPDFCSQTDTNRKKKVNRHTERANSLSLLLGENHG